MKKTKTTTAKHDTEATKNTTKKLVSKTTKVVVNKPRKTRFC